METQPHILIIGPPKSGKRTLASAVLKQQDVRRPGRSLGNYSNNVFIHTIESLSPLFNDKYSIYVVMLDPTSPSALQYLAEQSQYLSADQLRRTLVLVTKADLPTMHLHQVEDIRSKTTLRLIYTSIDENVRDQTAGHVLGFLDSIHYTPVCLGDDWTLPHDSDDNEVGQVPILQRAKVSPAIWSCVDLHEIPVTKR